ncbi:hypothetical protein PIB30_059749 [Stylosanthes scabra]|uniref:Uncharacterized protein n=1 Tax=Stylosanthes scabra TaxID=79078 RepID=A0ABU6WN58_9FABA|nr:hypothetical protein [Stylosanthes scabra]
MVEDTPHEILHPTNTMLLNTMHTNPTDILLCLERKELCKNQRQIEAKLTTLTLSKIHLCTQFTNSNSNNSSNASHPSNSRDPLSTIVNSKGKHQYHVSMHQPRRKGLLNEEVVECLNHEEVHEFLEEVEVKNEEQEVEDVDQEVENEDKEPKGMEIIHSISSRADPSKLPSKLHFKWANPSDMNFLGPQHYDLLEMDGQLKALCGVMDKKEMDSLGLDKSMFITWGKSKLKIYSGDLQKLNNSRAKDGALSLRSIWDLGNLKRSL